MSNQNTSSQQNQRSNQNKRTYFDLQDSNTTNSNASAINRVTQTSAMHSSSMADDSKNRSFSQGVRMLSNQVPIPQHQYQQQKQQSDMTEQGTSFGLGGKPFAQKESTVKSSGNKKENINSRKHRMESNDSDQEYQTIKHAVVDYDVSKNDQAIDEPHQSNAKERKAKDEEEPQTQVHESSNLIENKSNSQRKTFADLCTRRNKLIAFGFALLVIIIVLLVILIPPPATSSPTASPTRSPTQNPTLQSCLFEENQLIPFDMNMITPEISMAMVLQEVCMIYPNLDHCYQKSINAPYEGSNMVLDSGAWYFNDFLNITYKHGKDLDGKDALIIRMHVQYAHDYYQRSRSFVYNIKLSPARGCILDVSQYELYALDSGIVSGRRRCKRPSMNGAKESYIVNRFLEFPLFALFDYETGWTIPSPEMTGIFTADPNVSDSSPYSFLVGVSDTQQIFRIRELGSLEINPAMQETLDLDLQNDPFDFSFCEVASTNETEYLSNFEYYFSPLIPREDLGNATQYPINDSNKTCSANCIVNEDTIYLIQECFKRCVQNVTEPKIIESASRRLEIVIDDIDEIDALKSYTSLRHMINEQEQNVNERELLVPQLGKNCDVSNFAILSSLKPSSKTQYWPRPDISAVVDKTLCNIDEDIEKKIEQLKKELLTPKEEVQKLLNMIELNGSGSFLDIVDKVESLVKRIEYTLANVYDLAVDGFGIKSILRLFTNEIGNIELLLRVCSRIPFTAPFCVPAREIVQSIRLFFDEIISVIDSMINTEEFLINVSPVLSTLQDIRVEVIKIHKVVEKNTVQILKYGGFLTPVNDIAKKINAIVATFVKLLEDLVAVPTSFIGKTLDKVQFALDLVPQAKSSSSKVRKVIVDIDRYWGMTLRPFLKKINDVLDKKIEVGRIAANARESLRKKCVQGLVGPCKVGCEIVGKAVELVVDAIKLAEKVAEKAFNEAKEAARKVEEAAKKVIQAVEEAAKKVEEAVKKAIQSAIDTAKKIGEEIVRVAKEAERIAKEIAKKAEEVAKKIFEDAKEAAKNVVKKIKKIFGRRELEEKFSLTDGNKHPYLVAYGHRRLDTCEDICEKGVEFTCEVGSEVIIPRYLEVIPSFTIADILRGIDMSLSAIGIDKLIDEATRKIFEGIALPSLLNFAKEKLVFPNIEKELSKELKQGIAKIALPKEYQCYISNKFDMNKLLTCVPFNDLKSTWDSMFNQGVGTKCDVSLTCNPLSTSKCLGGRCCSSSAVMPPNCAACDDKGICSKCIDTMYLSTSPQIECKSRKLEGANCSSDDECQVGNACKNGLCCGKSCGVCNEGIEYFDGSSCVPKLLGGNSCTQNKQCKSNVCTSSTGVCCKESDNNCQSCSTGNGICTACKLSTHQLIQGACYEKRSPGDSCLTLNSTLYASSCSSSVCLNGRCCKSSLIKNCLSCSSIDGECKECQSGYFLQYKSGYSQCISKLSALSGCSNNDECQSNLCSGGICCSMTASFKSGCASCNSTGTCTGCMKGYFLLQDVCQANLEDGSSCSSSSICNSGSCLERCCSVGKSSKCKTCGPNGNCLECNTGYFVNQLGSCEMVGGAGSTCNVHQDCASLNCKTGKCCKSSNKSCDACNSLGECTSCLASTHYLLSGECQTKKSTGEVCNDLVLGMCEGSTCKGGRCCSKSNGDTCKTCNSSGLCETCTEDYYLSNGQCIKKMTSGPCINHNQCLYGQCKGKYCCNPDGSVNKCIACDSASLCSSCSIGVPDGGKCKILEKGKDCNSNSQCGSISCKGNYCCAASEPFCNKCSSGEGSCNGCISGYNLVNAVCLGIKARDTISSSGLEESLVQIMASAADRAGMGAIDVSTKIFEDLPGTYFNVISRNINHYGGYAIGWGSFRKLDTVYYFHIFSITHYASGLSFNPTPNDGHSDLVLDGIGAVDRNKFVEALDKVGSDTTAITSNLFERFGGTYFFAVIRNTPNGDDFTGSYAWAWGSFRKNGEQYSFHCWSISHHKPL